MSTSVHTDRVLNTFADEVEKNPDADVMSTMTTVVRSYAKFLERQDMTIKEVGIELDTVWDQVTHHLARTKRPDGKTWL